MVIARILDGLPLGVRLEGEMKKGFFCLILNAILIAPLSAGIVRAEEKVKKEKVQIVVAEKKNKDRSENGSELKSRQRDDRQSQ